MSELPPCGLYRTTATLAGVEAGRLVYFHNHGNPGPGIYLPEGWTGNRAKFAASGITLPNGFDTRALRPLPAEGFYRVSEPFFCCEKNCVRFETDAFVQLGYNGAGRALVFQPELAATSIAIPDRGTMIDDVALKNLVRLKLAERDRKDDISLPRGMIVH
jgi:hypothetical protein